MNERTNERKKERKNLAQMTWMVKVHRLKQHDETANYEK